MDSSAPLVETILNDVVCCTDFMTILKRSYAERCRKVYKPHQIKQRRTQSFGNKVNGTSPFRSEKKD